MTVTLYHNPACSTSRTVLGMIQDAGITPEIVLYLKTPPSRDKLKELVKQTGLTPRGLLRQKGALYEDLWLAREDVSDDAILDAMTAHPELINRPIVVTPLGARLCRPKELVFEVLPTA